MYEKLHRWTDEDEVVTTPAPGVPEPREETDDWNVDADANDRLGIRGKRREVWHIIIGED